MGELRSVTERGEKMTPKVSIILANYNEEKYIAEAIESVINQTYRNWELIIVDDASTDRSQERFENKNHIL